MEKPEFKGYKPGTHKERDAALRKKNIDVIPRKKRALESKKLKTPFGGEEGKGMSRKEENLKGKNENQ
jgi:hypothetical protein